MLKAIKKNRVIRILDEQAEEFKNLGYVITNMDGKTLYEPTDTDEELASLKKQNAALMQKVAELELLVSQQKAALEKAAPEKPAPEKPTDEIVLEQPKAKKTKTAKAE